MNPSTESEAGAPRKKPRLALLLATAFGLGYLPIAPGTFGSLGGVLLALSHSLFFMALIFTTRAGWMSFVSVGRVSLDPLLLCQGLLAIGVAALGVVAAGIAARYLGEKDPQKVVIDEVSGQQLTLVLGGLWPGLISGPGGIVKTHPLGVFNWLSSWPNWKYLLVGFILFRVFDIWKPFPVRQAESLPGGWGIMADDWVAAIYAALGLWVARAFGL